MGSSPHRSAILQALLVTFLWSTSWVLIKRNLDAIPPLTFAGLRYFLAFLVLLPLLWRQRAGLPRPTKREWGRLALLGLVFYTMTQGGQFVTLNYLPAVTFSLVLNATPLLVAVSGIFLLREVPGRLQWVGIGIFLAGALIYFAPGSLPGGGWLGYSWAAVTLGANAAAALLGRAINRSQTLSPLLVTVVSMGIGATVLLAAGVLVEGPPRLAPAAWGVIAWLAVVNTAFAFLLWNQTLRTLSAVESSVINNTMLVQIAVLAWIFLGERPTPVAIGGLLLAGVGALLVSLRR